MIDVGSLGSTLQVELDEEAPAARVGLVIMNTDERGEEAFKSLMPANVRVFTTRTGPDLDAYNQGRFELKGGYSAIAATLPPAGRVDLIAFSCTSGTIAAGGDVVSESFAPFFPGVPCTNPAKASAIMLKRFGVRKLSLLTPYPPKIHEQFPPFFERHGFAVSAHGSFDLATEPEIARVSEQSIVDAGHRLVSQGGAEALFVSCTAYDIVDRLQRISAQIGVPVYSSSQLLALHALSLLFETDQTAI